MSSPVEVHKQALPRRKNTEAAATHAKSKFAPLKVDSPPAASKRARGESRNEEDEFMTKNLEVCQNNR